MHGSTAGAVVVGGGRNALGFTRSLGRRGVRVWVLYDPDESVAIHSRWVERAIPFSWSRPGSAERLRELGVRHCLAGWSLLATDDETAYFLSANRPVLDEQFLASVPSFDVLSLAHDKRKTYDVADAAGVGRPWSFVGSDGRIPGIDSFPFPVVLKPAVKEQLTRLTHERAWRADSAAELKRLYALAKAELPPAEIILQELVPGTGLNQFSFAALCEDGEVLASVTAQRLRQYPVQFGRSSSFVKTIDDEGVADAATRLLRQMRMTGVAEVELKRDDRDGRLKVLDVNPRLWTWYSLCARAGVDFPYLLWLQSQGLPLPKVSSRAGVRWMRVTTDVMSAAVQLRSGNLGLRGYARSFGRPLAFAVFDGRDPVPSLVGGPVALKRFARKTRNVRRRSDRTTLRPGVRTTPASDG